VLRDGDDAICDGHGERLFDFNDLGETDPLLITPTVSTDVRSSNVDEDDVRFFPIGDESPPDVTETADNFVAAAAAR